MFPTPLLICVTPKEKEYDNAFKRYGKKTFYATERSYKCCSNDTSVFYMLVYELRASNILKLSNI